MIRLETVGWKVWRQRLRCLAAGEVDEAWAAETAASVSGDGSSDDRQVSAGSVDRLGMGWRT